MKKDFDKIPLGPDHPIEKKIKWAKRIYSEYSHHLLQDKTICALLEKYRQSIEENWQVMADTGVVKECTSCALQDGGSCCGSGIENKFDVVNLLINLLMGVELPSQPWDPTGCWFLGEKGCLITARHVICVNFICKRLYDALDSQSIHRVQAAMQKETENAFLLEEYLKVWLAKNG